MKILQEPEINSLDTILCKLNSLGTILVHLTTMECQNPDIASLSDLGRIIQEQSLSGLDLIGESKEIADPFMKFDIGKSCEGAEFRQKLPNATS